jgi:nucleotide-binding universal stress UspA family protein
LYVHTGKENEDSPVEVSLQSHLHEATAQLELPANIKLRERVLLAPAVYEGIRRAAEEMRTDLVVLGTHGHNFVARLIIGSVTTACSRHLPFPLLVVPARTTVATESPS